MFKYEKPFMEVVEFEDEVIITSTGDNGSKTNGERPVLAAGDADLGGKSITGGDSPFVDDKTSIAE